MHIVLTNVYDDNNRGSCALTWAALELLELAFPGCDVTILPIAARNRDAFRHTVRRFPRVVIADPPFDGADKSDFARIVLLLGAVARILLARHRTHDDRHWLKCIRAADLVVVRGGVSIHTVEESLRGDAQFLTRSLPLLASYMLRKPFVFLGAQIGPFRTRFGRSLSRFLLTNARGLIARDEVAVSEVMPGRVGEARVLLMPDTAFVLASDDITVPPSPVSVESEAARQTWRLSSRRHYALTRVPTHTPHCLRSQLRASAPRARSRTSG